MYHLLCMMLNHITQHRNERPQKLTLPLSVSRVASAAAAIREFDKPSISPDLMALAFSDLHTADGFKALEGHLASKTYISGDELSKDEIKVFAAVPLKPGAEFPNAGRWYDTVTAVTASRFPSKAASVSASSTAAAVAPAVEAAKDEDDLDLFGDEPEEEKQAAAARAAANPAKKKEGGKSSVLMDTKPWYDEIDMKKLEEKVRSVQMEGLTLGASKLVVVGYGINKLQIMLTIMDDLVSVES